MLIAQNQMFLGYLNFVTQTLQLIELDMDRCHPPQALKRLPVQQQHQPAA